MINYDNNEFVLFDKLSAVQLGKDDCQRGLILQ